MITSHQQAQTRTNFYTNIFSLLINVLIGIYYTPYLINNLGLVAYGILPLALIINQYIGVISGTLTSAFTRFYSIDLQQNNYKLASRDISTALSVITIIVLLLSPVLLLVISNIDSIFTFPARYLYSAKGLFLFTFLSFFISIYTSLLNVTLYARNKLNIIAQLNNLRIILKFVLILLFFNVLDVDIYYVGLANLLSEIVVISLSIYYYYCFKPDGVDISIKNTNKKILYAILGMSSWVLIQQVGDAFIYRTDNIVVNHFWGSEASGALGAVSELGGYIKLVIGAIGGLFGPLILLAYSENRHRDVQSMTMQQVLLVGCLASILTGIVSGLSIPILSNWINPSFSRYSLWLQLKLIVIPFYAAGGILAFVYRAWNKVRMPAIITIFLGVVDFIVIILLANIINTYNSINIILIVSACFSIAQCFIANLYCVIMIYPNCKKASILITGKMIISYITALLLSYIPNLFLSNMGIIELIAAGALSGSISLIITLKYLFSTEDRVLLKSVIFKH